MSVHAFVTAVRALPEPTVLLILNGIDEVLADLLGGGPRVTMLAENNLAQLLLVPVIHSIILLRLLLLLLLDLSRVGVQILLGSLALQAQVVAELASLTLLTMTLLEEHADNGLRIDTKRYFLRLHRLEQLR